MARWNDRNERLVAAGQLDEFGRAAKARSGRYIVEIVSRVEVANQAEASPMSVSTRQIRVLTGPVPLAPTVASAMTDRRNNGHFRQAARRLRAAKVRHGSKRPF
jgi:hypothetical protein